MAILPEVFREAPFVNLSFDWGDIISGFTQVQYYGGQVADSSGNIFKMQDKVFDPWHVVRNNGGDEENSGRYKIYTCGSSDASVADLDFDLTPFTATRVLEGTASINIPFGIATDVSTQVVSIYAIATIRRVRSAVETDLATATSSTLANADDGITTEDSMLSWDITVPQSYLKAGDTLRVNINIHAWRSAGTGSPAVIIMTDPLARDVAVTGGSSANDIVKYTGGRTLNFFIPYKVNV